MKVSYYRFNFNGQSGKGAKFLLERHVRLLDFGIPTPQTPRPRQKPMGIGYICAKPREPKFVCVFAKSWVLEGHQVASWGGGESACIARLDLSSTDPLCDVLVCRPLSASRVVVEQTPPVVFGQYAQWWAYESVWVHVVILTLGSKQQQVPLVRGDSQGRRATGQGQTEGMN